VRDSLYPGMFLANSIRICAILISHFATGRILLSEEREPPQRHSFETGRLSEGLRAPFKMHQYKIHSRGTRLIRCSYAHFPPLRWSILPPSRHTTANRSLAIPSNINISAPGYALLKSISREIDSAFFASFHRRDER